MKSSIYCLLFYTTSGLKSPMCGTNTSLTKDVTFTTQSYFITVIFQRNTAGMNFKSKFNLTFLSFSEGKHLFLYENLFRGCLRIPSCQISIETSVTVQKIRDHVYFTHGLSYGIRCFFLANKVIL